MVLLSGVNVTQFGTAETGPCPGSFGLGNGTSPISLRSASEKTNTALLGMLVTHSVLLSGATPIPCEGEVARPASVSNSVLVAGSVIRATSLRAAKSTTAKPLVSESCTKMRLVEPSGPASIVIG